MCYTFDLYPTYTQGSSVGTTGAKGKVNALLEIYRGYGGDYGRRRCRERKSLCVLGLTLLRERMGFQIWSSVLKKRVWELVQFFEKLGADFNYCSWGMYLRRHRKMRVTTLNSLDSFLWSTMFIHSIFSSFLRGLSTFFM